MANTLLAKLGISTASFAKGLDDAEGKLKKFAGSAKGIFGAFGFGLGIMSVKEFINSLDELGKRAKDFTITADGLKWLQYRARDAGVEFSALDDGLKTLKKSIGDALEGSGAQYDAFKRLNVEIQNADGTYKSFAEVLEATAKGFQNTGRSADEAKLAEDLFGGSGVEVVRVLRAHADGLAENINKFGDYTKAANTAADVNKKLNEFTERATERSVAGLTWFEKFYSAVALAFTKTGGSLMDAYSILEENERLILKAEEERVKASRQIQMEKQREAALVKKEKQSDEEMAQMQKDLEDAEYKSEILAEKMAEDLAKEQAKEFEEMQAREEKFYEEKKKAEDDLQKLYKERAEITKQIAENAKAAQKEMLRLVSQNGEGQTQSKASKAEKYRQKAEDARAKGRWNDYAKYSDQADKYESEAVDKRKSDLESAGREALRRGDTKTFNRLQEAYKQEGFAANPTNEQVEKLTNIDDSTKKTAQKLEELVNGLKGGTR